MFAADSWGHQCFEPELGLTPEAVSRNDPRLTPMFDAMARVDRRAMGFTQIEHDASIRIEWVHPTFDSLLRFAPKNYDAMLHVSGKTSRTVAFKRAGDGYEWIGEQQTFEGPRTYDSVDGTFNEAITVTYDRVRIPGFPINTTAVLYRGEEPGLAGRRQLSLDDIRPWLKKWGYDGCPPFRRPCTTGCRRFMRAIALAADLDGRPYGVMSPNNL